MKLDYIGICYQHYGDRNYAPYIQLTYHGKLGNCCTRISSPHWVTEEFAYRNQNNFGRTIRTDKDVEIIAKCLRQLNITNIDKMVGIMLEMIQLTKKHDNYKGLLP